jgi:redox-sensitive bicupin YhaK (pirin superfamily)
VQRVLPAAIRRTVGPFVFFDRMGPTEFAAGNGLDVRPHPHIGLATVTYLFEGELLHRDSLGTTQPIRPSEVNWMLAGRGIVHSERTSITQRAAPSRLSGIQAWVGLPQKEEQAPPCFSHHGAEELPQIEAAGVRLRLIAGSYAGLQSPVPTCSPLFYADAQLEAGATLAVSGEYPERGIFISQGSLDVEHQSFAAGTMIVFAPGGEIRVHAPTAARLLLLGGAPLDGERQVWWNFVSSSPERMQRAADDWRGGRFDRVPGDDEFIPLPSTPLPQSTAPPVVKPVDYP